MVMIFFMYTDCTDEGVGGSDVKALAGFWFSECSKRSGWVVDFCCAIAAILNDETARVLWAREHTTKTTLLLITLLESVSLALFISSTLTSAVSMLHPLPVFPHFPFPLPPLDLVRQGNFPHGKKIGKTRWTYAKECMGMARTSGYYIMRTRVRCGMWIFVCVSCTDCAWISAGVISMSDGLLPVISAGR